MFDNEKPQFEINPGAILLEVILPTSSAADDSFYIVGDFNGGEAAIGNPAWKLQKADGVAKWGIYLNPSTFVNGKTLADGFTFHSDKQGDERSVFDEPVSHTLDVGVGTRTNVWVDQWAAFFSGGGNDKEFVTIYVEVPEDWEATALYMWYGPDGTEVKPLGDWPGGAPTGETGFGDRVFSYFDLDKSLTGQTVNFIFNNNNKGKQTANITGITLDGDLYYKVNDDLSFETIDPADLGEPTEVYSGYTIYVDDQTGWDELALYGEYNHVPVDVAFPGWQMAGTKNVEGIDFKYFQPGKAFNNATLNLVFSNNLKVSALEVQGPQNFVLDHDLYVRLTADSYEVLFENEGVMRTIYVVDNTGWDALTLYGWGVEFGGGWPGMQPTGEKNISGVIYKYFEIPAEYDGEPSNLIFNNNDGGAQFDAATVTFDRDFYYTITATEATPVTFKVYVNDLTEWGALALYGWGDYELGGGWPGLQPTSSNGFSVFELPVEAIGKSINLIFNNNGGGAQFDGPNVVVDRDFYFTINATGRLCRVYVDDQSGWDALALYAWGGFEFAGWPGLQPAGTKTIGSVDYTIFEVPEGAIGQEENLIFNNNGGGAQFDGPNVTIVGDLYYRITDSAATEVKP
uniref:Starch-binding module 26 domain-containing protein n=2 Tax=termite gut metagenome TaxID=433724 RepID=S0DFL4_9ZZZZ